MASNNENNDFNNEKNRKTAQARFRIRPMCSPRWLRPLIGSKLSSRRNSFWKYLKRLILVEHVFNTLADRYRDSRTSFMLTLSGPFTVPKSLTRMWLYAAGLLLMDAVLKLNDEASPITVSSMYGLILNVVKVRVYQTPNGSCPDRKPVWETLVKVLLVGTIGGVVERMPRLSGALVPLVIQNSSVVISAIFLALVFGSSDAVIPAWGLFTIVTVFSSIAVLGRFSKNSLFWLVGSTPIHKPI